MGVISVIIPVYKVEKWLDRCLQTVVSQTYRELEILLVDDGSPDACGAMCDGWAQKDGRIRVIHKENGGLSSARNAGLEAATGEYVMFVDSDDLLHPELCARLHRALTGSKAGVAVCDCAHIFGDSAPEYALSEERGVMAATQAICAMWYQTSFLPSAWAKLYRRDIFRQLRFTEGQLYEDIDVMHLLLAEGSSVVYEPSRLYGYVHREGSITTRSFGPRDLDILKVARKLLEYAAAHPELESAARCYACVAALRVALNAPRELTEGHAQAQELLKAYAKQVRKDPNARKKTRIGLWLYAYCRPLMGLIYRRVNRWK